MATATMMDLSNNTTRKLMVMALLHDLGKVCLPDKILLKPGRLEEQEWDMMKKHPWYSAEMLKQLPDFNFCYVPVLAHHERLDGKGYPQGRRANQIHLESRIIAVAEAYDDMVTPRPYRRQLSPQAAVEELKNQSGSQFDGDVVRAFIKAMASAQRQA